jgi:hypothetical protein
MPCETVRIRISSLPFPEPGATFLSRLAYPHKTNSSEETEFWLAIYRRAILAHSQMHPEWGHKPQRIRPAFFMSSKIDGRAIHSGKIQLEHRFIVAACMLIPTLVKHLVGRKRAGPRVKDLRRLAMLYVGKGWKSGSRTTFSSRIWGQSQSVVHAAAGCLLATPEPRTNDGTAIDSYNDIPSVDDLVELIVSPELLKRAVMFSEIIRQNSPLLKELRIKEQDTIQFLPDDLLPDFPPVIG